jgi:hypothetical protein
MTDEQYKSESNRPPLSRRVSHCLDESFDSSLEHRGVSRHRAFSWLHAIPMADVGLFQAYSLMMVIGIVLWIGSYQESPWKWDLIGLLAHVSPLIANFMFADLLSGIGVPSTVPLHGFFILLELFALSRYWISGRREAMA